MNILLHHSYKKRRGGETKSLTGVFALSAKSQNFLLDMAGRKAPLGRMAALTFRQLGRNCLRLRSLPLSCWHMCARGAVKFCAGAAQSRDETAPGTT